MAKPDRHIPFLDPLVKHVGTSKLREFNSAALRGLTETYVVQDNDEPIAVVIPYQRYLAMQAAIESTGGYIYVNRNRRRSFGERHEKDRD